MEGKVNAWDSLTKWLENKESLDPNFKRISCEVSSRLHEDGCNSAWIHIAYFIEHLYNESSKNN